MVISEKQSRQLDQILQQLLKEKAFSVERIQKEFFPEEDYEYCLNLFST